MRRSTYVLLMSLVCIMATDMAHAATATQAWVNSNVKTPLMSNQITLRDMLTEKDADGAWVFTLDTNAQTAFTAINELKAALDTKADADDVLTADALTELNDAIDALESGKASAVDLQNLQNTVDALGDTYATDAEVSTAIANVQSAIDNIDLSAYAKTADLATVATTGQYSDLEGKPEIPSIAGLATETALNNLQTTLTNLINAKQDAGQYLVAADLTKLENDIATLQSGKADLATVTAIQTTISKLNETYATDADVETLINGVKALIPSLEDYAKTADVEIKLAGKQNTLNAENKLSAEYISGLSTVATTGQYSDLEGKPEIPTIPTNVSAFNNDAGYITESALAPYAKSADVEMVDNKLATATAEDIAAMSSDEKATKYPSIAVSQTIANAAVTKVNEFAGDLTDLETKVETNTADIAALGETVDEVEVIALAAIPKPGKICQAASGSCALTVDTDGNLTWAVIAGALNGN